MYMDWHLLQTKCSKMVSMKWNFFNAEIYINQLHTLEHLIGIEVYKQDNKYSESLIVNSSDGEYVERASYGRIR